MRSGSHFCRSRPYKPVSVDPRDMMGRVGRRNSLQAVEEQVLEEHKKRRHKRKRYNSEDRTRIAANVRKGVRIPAPVPKNRSLQEIEEIDPQSLQLRHKRGRPRIYFKEGTEDEFKVPEEELTFAQLVRADQQKRNGARRARVRKWEARVVKAQEVLDDHSTRRENRELDIYDEERAIAEGILELEDWDDEELIRGYRRGRNGKFGPQPKYIPREVQQEAFRRLVHRGNRKLRQAYMRTIEGLIDLAHNGDSEKVKLEAIKELLNRIVGKVPDIVVGAQMEQPWESILGDSIIAFGEEDPLEMHVDVDGVAKMEPIVVDAEVVTEAQKAKEARSARAKARRRRAKTDPGALTADDEPGSGTGRPTSSVAQTPGSPRTKPKATKKKTPEPRRQSTVARENGKARSRKET